MCKVSPLLRSIFYRQNHGPYYERTALYLSFTCICSSPRTRGSMKCSPSATGSWPVPSRVDTDRTRRDGGSC